MVGYSYSSDTTNEKIHVYDFKTENDIELQDKAESIRFADNSVTYAYIDDKNRLSLYVEGEKAVKELCSVGENANLCGISSDGKQIIWSEEKDNELLVYMMKNSIPERIGKLGKKQKYSSFPNVIFLIRVLLLAVENMEL